MNRDPVAAAGIASGFIAPIATFVTQAMPIFQALSLIAATVASVFAARYYRKKKSG